MAVLQTRGFHPWHDILSGRRPPFELTAVIEIPTNERTRQGPGHLLPRPRAPQRRPLSRRLRLPGPHLRRGWRSARRPRPHDHSRVHRCLVDARPIGLFHLVDRGVADEKVLAVPTGDPYKDLEGTRTETRGFEGAGEARSAVERAIEVYREKFDRSG